MDPGFGDLPLFFRIALPLFGLFFLATVAFIVVGALRGRKVLRDAGLDPLAAQAQLAVRLAQGPLMATPRTLEQRLAELDDLRQRGVISEEEHAAARTAALADG